MNLRVLFSLLSLVLIGLAAIYAPLDLTAADRVIITLALSSAILWTLEPVPIEWTALALLFAFFLNVLVTFEM